jgi:D-lactate dehydrogenase
MIRAAVFDAKPYDREPLQDASAGAGMQDNELARLLTFPNVLITSHQAFLNREALSDIARTTIANLAALADGTPFVEGPLLT